MKTPKNFLFNFVFEEILENVASEDDVNSFCYS